MVVGCALLTLMSEEAPQRDYKLRELFNALRYLIRLGIAACETIENLGKIAERRESIPNFHRPCFDQTARTCSSVANSPRAAAVFERAIAVRSSSVKAT